MASLLSPLPNIRLATEFQQIAIAQHVTGSTMYPSFLHSFQRQESSRANRRLPAVLPAMAPLSARRSLAGLTVRLTRAVRLSAMDARAQETNRRIDFIVRAVERTSAGARLALVGGPPQAEDKLDERRGEQLA